MGALTEEDGGPEVVQSTVSSAPEVLEPRGKQAAVASFRRQRPKYNKLELTWVNKDKVLAWDDKKRNYVWVLADDIRGAETRLLKEKEIVGQPSSLFELKEKKWVPTKKPLPKEEQNLLIRGDNLLALKSIEDDFAGKIKLIYIDPPFNTGARIDAEGKEVGYDDGLEHSIWLSMMKDRLEIMKRMLRKDGAIFVHIDDLELGHLKVLLDEKFGPKNFVTMITVKRSATTGHKAINPSPVNVTDYILGYARNKDFWKYKIQHVARAIDKAYNRYIENYSDNFENWRFISLSEAFCKESGSESITEARKALGPAFEEKLSDFILSNSERVVESALPNYAGVSKAAQKMIDKSREDRNRVFRLVRDGFSDMYFYRGRRILFYKDKLKEIEGKLTTGEPLTNLWTDIPFQGIANEGNVVFRKGKKPEKMMKRIIEMVTEPNEWVLDSFAGSGTTGAVAHKLGRRYVMIELAPHAETHALKRLKGVADGSDQTGMSKEVQWQGGGGVRYCILGKSLFKTSDGVVEVGYDNGDLIEAVCKIEGFRFVGKEFLSKTKLHGAVDSKRYCRVTEEFVTQDYLDQLTTEISEEESLVVYCLRKSSKLRPPSNIQVKKIPRDITKRFKLPGGRD